MFLQQVPHWNHSVQRIVSLVPSQTELLFDLGLEQAVVGITKFCVHPPGWRTEKAVVGGTKNVNLEKVTALRPDLIIANKEENVRGQVEALAEDYPVWLTDVNNLSDALQMISDIGRLTNTRLAAEALVQQVQQGFANIHFTQVPVGRDRGLSQRSARGWART